MKLEKLIQKLSPERSNDEIKAIAKVYGQFVPTKVFDNMPADTLQANCQHGRPLPDLKFHQEFSPIGSTEGISHNSATTTESSN